MTQYIIVEGNPCDGYVFFGPFSVQEDAFRYADDNLDYGREWCIAKLIHPNDEATDK